VYIVVSIRYDNVNIDGRTITTNGLIKGTTTVMTPFNSSNKMVVKTAMTSGKVNSR
jgi:hypothetical protein